MPDRFSAQRHPTLYEVLAQPAPPGSIRGETRITGAKETLDDDMEEDDAMFLLDPR